jgi:predicted TIM-barrel fold metal-dependent hydrolase
MTLSRFLLLPLAIISLYSSAVVRADDADLYFIDAHSQVGSEQVLQRVISLMDKAGVQRTILSGRRKLKSSDIANYAERYPSRIIASIRTKGGAYKKNNKGYYKALKREVASGRFGAIAELLMYHAPKGAKADKVVVYPNDERVQTALKHARKKGWPLVVHIEFASLPEEERTKFMKMLRKMLDKYPKHPFAMIHMGQLDADDVRQLIESHDNVYFMTSHTNPIAIRKSNQPWTNMFKGEVLAPEWEELVVKYPDPFILAFDNVWPDQWGDFFLREAGYWRKAFAALPKEVAHAIAHGNAERLWNIPKE